MTIKVLIITADNILDGAIGGKNTHIRLLQMGLSHYSITSKVIFPPNNIPDMKYREYFKCFFKYNIFPVGNDSIRFSYKLIEVLSTEIIKSDFKPDIIHCQDVISLLAALNSYDFSKNKTPIILTVHGYFTQESIDNSQKNSKKYHKELQKFGMTVEKEAIKNSSKIIAVDSRIKEYLIRNFKYNSKEILILPNATDIQKFSPILEEKKSSLREMRGYKNDDKIILVPRRLVPKNGVEYAIDAIKRISSSKIKLLIVGDGPLMTELIEKSKNEDRIQLLGPVSYNEIDEYYKLSDIILIPSITSNNIQEATSLSMLEGMACEKFVICSNIGGMREVMQDRVTGFLVDEKNPEMIANIIEMLISSNQNLSYIKRNARKFVEDNHSFLSHSLEHINIYKTLLEVTN